MGRSDTSPHVVQAQVTDSVFFAAVGCPWNLAVDYHTALHRPGTVGELFLTRKPLAYLDLIKAVLIQAGDLASAFGSLVIGLHVFGTLTSLAQVADC